MSMRALSGVVLAVFLASCGAGVDGSPLGASRDGITSGELDGNDHPYVGLLLVMGEFRNLDGSARDGSLRYVWRCSGTMVSPTVFLTAGHCVGDSVEDYDGDGTIERVHPVKGTVFFQTSLTRPIDFSLAAGTGDVHPHPLYANFAGFPNTHDLGVVVMPKAISMPKYGQVAALGTLDGYQTDPRAGAYIEAVGYGLQLSRPNQVVAELVRHQATEQFATMQGALTDGYNIQTIDTPRALPQSLQGDSILPKAGGTCFGDSGGPQFLPGTNVVVAVTSYGLNGNCAGTGFHYRTDIADAASFLGPYLQQGGGKKAR